MQLKVFAIQSDRVLSTHDLALRLCLGLKDTPMACGGRPPRPPRPGYFSRGFQVRYFEFQVAAGLLPAAVPFP